MRSPSDRFADAERRLAEAERLASVDLSQVSDLPTLLGMVRELDALVIAASEARRQATCDLAQLRGGLAGAFPGVVALLDTRRPRRRRRR